MTDKDICSSGVITKPTMGKYVIKKGKSTSQPYYFVLKAENGETIATSEMYSSKDACNKGIESVRRNASTLIVEDETNE